MDTRWACAAHGRKALAEATIVEHMPSAMPIWDLSSAATSPWAGPGVAEKAAPTDGAAPTSSRAPMASLYPVNIILPSPTIFGAALWRIQDQVYTRVDVCADVCVMYVRMYADMRMQMRMACV